MGIVSTKSNILYICNSICLRCSRRRINNSSNTCSSRSLNLYINDQGLVCHNKHTVIGITCLNNTSDMTLSFYRNPRFHCNSVLNIKSRKHLYCIWISSCCTNNTINSIFYRVKINTNTTRKTYSNIVHRIGSTSTTGSR